MDGDETAEASENEQIKSTAIVKYSLPKQAQFMKLQCNTDLNLPPSNWLSSSVDSYGLQPVVSHPKGFSSFRMAQMFPDCVGDVDVVSDAENIKKLLKIPYHKGHISMMVHRIDNTLLIDDFDIYKHLIRTAETEWRWLRDFFFENVNRATCDEDKNLYIKSRTREALKEKNLVSKFLYHSLVPSDIKETTNLLESKRRTPSPDPLLPEPSPSTECPDSPPADHPHNRDVLWTFEDIDMLLGTDLPIFGGGTHPCISLRLCDASKPISVLTGIDYWLDNLMSNVPEVVMCYHLNGIVQKYELIKTEDLPRMDDSKFSPKLIRDVAQSILSFLKSKATKAGHTYWLFKGKDEEVIKLYDLTSLCSADDVENGTNPFTIPVAMLLYRVARSMKHSTDRKQPGTVRMLLKHCIKLLPYEKYPEIVTSSMYMLSDLYVPARTNPEDPGLEDGIQDDEEGDIFDDDDLKDQEENDDDATLVLDNNRMEKFKNYYKSPAPIVGGLEERCSQAILHAANGLSCLKYFPEQSTYTKTTEKEEEVKMAKPSEPIPMPYSKLDSNIPPTAGSSKKARKKENRKKKAANKNQDKNSNALLPKNPNEAQPLPAWGGVKVQDDISWKDHLKTLLYEKVVLVYAILAEHHFVNRNYGTSLRCIGLLARCQLVMNRLQYTSGALRENCLLGRAGDCFIMMVQMWEECEKFRQQLQNVTEEDCKLMEQLEQDERLYKINIGNSAMKCVFIYEIRTIEQMLLSSIDCYEKALKLSESDSILRRLGNSLNEVGSYYLNLAKKDKIGKDIILTCKKGEPYLVRGLDIFEKIKDDANIALLHTNMGHLHRCIAYAHSPEQRTQLTQKEKFYYNKSVTSYKKALQVLGERNPNPSIWDAIRWELSTALFNIGTISHEYPPPHLSKAEAEKEVIDMLQRALQYCDMEESNPKYPLYLYRAAIIYYRIGSIHHSHIWNASGDFISRKNIIQLANTNYEKSAKMYFQCFDGVNYLTAQMQRLALSEFLSEVAGPMPIVKIKYLQQCLDIVFEMDDMLQLLVEDKIELQEEKEDTGLPDADKTYKTCHSLLGLIAQRLQNVLKMLVKLNISTPPPHKDSKKMAELYKTCYKFSFELREDMEFKEILETLSRVVKNIKKEFGK